MNSKPAPYPITPLQQAHQVAGTLINQGIPECYRQDLITVIFQVLLQAEGHLNAQLSAQELIQLLPAEVILEAAEQLTAKVY